MNRRKITLISIAVALAALLVGGSFAFYVTSERTHNVVTSGGVEIRLFEDTNQVGIGWLDISTLNLQPLYPSKLRRQIMNYYQGKPYKVYLGNEEAGDPECSD